MGKMKLVPSVSVKVDWQKSNKNQKLTYCIQLRFNYWFQKKYFSATVCLLLSSLNNFDLKLKFRRLDFNVWWKLNRINEHYVKLKKYIQLPYKSILRGFTLYNNFKCSISIRKSHFSVSKKDKVLEHQISKLQSQ